MATDDEASDTVTDDEASDTATDDEASDTAMDELFDAIRERDAAAAKSAIESGADVNANYLGITGATALMAACSARCDKVSVPLAWLALFFLAWVLLVFERSDNLLVSRPTVLIVACMLPTIQTMGVCDLIIVYFRSPQLLSLYA